MGNPLYGSNKVDNQLDHAGGAIVLAAGTHTLEAADSGKDVVISAAAATTINLPTPEKGMNFMILHAVNGASTGNVVIDTGSDSYYLKGGCTIHDTNATAADAEILPAIEPDGNSNSVMTCATMDTGSWIKFVSDGTVWYHTGLLATVAATACAYADQS